MLVRQRNIDQQETNKAKSRKVMGRNVVVLADEIGCDNDGGEE